MTTISAAVFGLAWWLGLYLLARNPAKPLLRRAGLGLLAYALAIACEALGGLVADPVALLLRRGGALLGFVPALCWSGAVLLMLPASLPQRAWLERGWQRGLVPLGGGALALAALAGLLDGAGGLALVLVGGALVLGPLALCLGLLAAHWRALRPGGTGGVVAVATLFFGLSAALLLAPVAPLSRQLVLLALGFDIAMLGLAVARFDAFDEGETLRRDMLRSLLGAGAAGLLFGGPVLVMLLQGATPSGPLAALLFFNSGAAIAAQVLAGPLQALLDRLAFPATPALREARAELRAAAELLPRRDETTPLDELDETEFARLTRRALSYYGDLPRLAGSPLVALPAIDGRLAARGAPAQPLERAAELKTLLAEGIARLRPRDGAFGTSDEWRHYNALYFPYVVGLRPYSQRASHNGLDPVAREALEWLATQVPERTLHNWQNAAARLVAAELRASLHPAVNAQTPDERAGNTNRKAAKSAKI